MTDYDDLCARLRDLYVQHGTNYVQAAAEAIESLREQNAALRRIVRLAKEMRSVMLPADAEDDEILRRFDAALLAWKESVK